MPDDETNQPSPDRQPGAAPEQVTGSEQIATPGQVDASERVTESAQASPEQTGEPDAATGQETEAADNQATGNEPAGNEPGSTRGRGAWAAVAALCVVLGAIASVLGARAVARNDTSSTRTAFAQSSKAIATTVKLAIQRQEELTIAAATYFAANPKATPAEFGRWVTWARTQRRYPELDALGLLPAPPPPAKASASAASGKASGASGNASGASGNASNVPDGASGTPGNASSAPANTSGTSADASSTPAKTSTPPVHVSPAQLLSRDTGLSIYRQISAGHRPALAIQTPVYRGNVTPHTVFGRTAASVGWLRTVLVPSAMLAQVLTGHPGLRAGGYLPERHLESRLLERRPGRGRAEREQRPARRLDRHELRPGGRHERVRQRQRARGVDRRDPAERAARPARGRASAPPACRRRRRRRRKRGSGGDRRARSAGRRGNTA